MHLLDTDTFTHLEKGTPRVVNSMQALPDPEVGITVITWIEVLRGRCEALLKSANARELLRAQDNLARARTFLDRMLVLPVNDRAAAVFDSLRGIKNIKKIARGDLLIAVIALAYKAV